MLIIVLCKLHFFMKKKSLIRNSSLFSGVPPSSLFQLSVFGLNKHSKTLQFYSKFSPFFFLFLFPFQSIEMQLKRNMCWAFRPPLSLAATEYNAALVIPQSPLTPTWVWRHACFSNLLKVKDTQIGMSLATDPSTWKGFVLRFLFKNSACSVARSDTLSL